MTNEACRYPSEHCWHMEPRRDCKSDRPNYVNRCCKCGAER